MSKRQIEAITFDASGTLIEPTPSVGAIYAEVLNAFEIKSDVAEINASFRVAFKEVKQKHQRILDKACWRDIVRVALRQVPEEQFDAVFETLWETFALPKRWAILPEAKDTLTKLKKKGYRLAVITNNDSRLLNVFEGLGLTPFFEAIFISADIGFEKPDKRIFDHVGQTLSVPSEKLMHVGDSKLEDYEGARNAGWQALLLGQDIESMGALDKLL